MCEDIICGWWYYKGSDGKAGSQLWKTLKSIGLSKRTPGSSKTSLCYIYLKLYLKIVKLQIFLTTFLLQWQKKWLTNYLKDQYFRQTIFKRLLAVIEEEIENLFDGLTASKVTLMDSLPARFLKDGTEVIACSLSHIINFSLHSSQIPEDMKNARVVPLYKKTK